MYYTADGAGGPNVLSVNIIQVSVLTSVSQCNSSQQGRNIGDVDKPGNPFIECECDGAKMVTEFRSKTNEPVWRQTLELSVLDPAKTLTLKVIGRHKSLYKKPTFLGESVRIQKHAVVFHPLTACSCAGQLRFTLLEFVDADTPNTKILAKAWHKLSDGNWNTPADQDDTSAGELELELVWRQDQKAFREAEFRKQKQSKGGRQTKAAPSRASFGEDSPRKANRRETGADKRARLNEAQEMLVRVLLCVYIVVLVLSCVLISGFAQELAPASYQEGDYQIQVHVIEARDLKGEDLSGLR